jgi:hypothetical protein
VQDDQDERPITVAVQAERMVLSAALRGGTGAITELLAPSDFFEIRNARIYDHLLELHFNGDPTTETAVLARAVAAGPAQRTISASYLHDLMELDSPPEQVGFYARAVLDAGKQRRQIADAARLAQASTIPDATQRDLAIARIVEEITARPTDGKQDAGAPRYGDVAALLDGGIPPPPQPEILHRSDGHALIYRGKVNILYGDSESGKTWIALAALADVLHQGGSAAVVDLDHNGMAETITRLIMLGAKPADLSDPGRFRYCEPTDVEDLDYFVTNLAAWEPWAVTVDSLGEVLPMLGLSSNSPDDYTIGHRRVLTPLADAGAAVIAIDHLPKDDDARTKGQTGTMAKKRAVNGSTLRVTVHEQFTPGHGGSANLVITKDRPGGLRGHCPPGKNAPAGRFVLTDPGDGTLGWHVTDPRSVVAAAVATGASVTGLDADVETLRGLLRAPTSQRDVQKRLKWGAERSLNALRAWRDQQQLTIEDT